MVDELEMLIADAESQKTFADKSPDTAELAKNLGRLIGRLKQAHGWAVVIRDHLTEANQLDK
jgi:hypothetical protein